MAKRNKPSFTVMYEDANGERQEKILNEWKLNAFVENLQNNGLNKITVRPNLKVENGVLVNA